MSGAGVAGQEQAPLRRVAEDRRAVDREETSSLRGGAYKAIRATLSLSSDEIENARGH